MSNRDRDNRYCHRQLFLKRVERYDDSSDLQRRQVFLLHLATVQSDGLIAQKIGVALKVLQLEKRDIKTAGIRVVL
jgi:hypothetical protein